MVMATGQNMRAADAAEGGPGWSAGAGWKAIEQKDLQVKAGSVLDFSSLVEPGPAGKHGAVIINKQGMLAFSDRPEEPLRFLCCDEVMDIFPYKTQEEIDAYADQVVRAGYNMYRAHFLDNWLMRGSDEDLKLNPERLDIWDRLQAALKKRGVYLYFDATTSWLMYSHIAPWVPEAKNVPNRGVLINWDQSAREHWKTGVTNILTRVNPYTGTALKDDPQVAIMQARNESTVIFRLNSRRTRGTTLDKVVTDAFRNWLTQKYKNTEGLRSAWTVRQADGSEKGYLANDRTLETVEMPDQKGNGPDVRDLFTFLMEAEKETFLWEREQLRNIGVKCPVLDYNAMLNTYIQIVRDTMEMTDNHAYHGHPTSYVNPGSQVDSAESATKNFVSSYIPLSGSRQVGRPAVCSEWGHPFWQPWRGVEAGLIVPAYASLQGWQMIAQHASAIRLAYDQPIKPFYIYSDPQAKAVERIGALLYRRGDVQTSPHLIQANIDSEQALAGKLNLRDGLPETLTRLGLLSKFGIMVKGAPGSAPRGEYQADVEFNHVGSGSRIEISEGAQTVVVDPGNEIKDVVEKEVSVLRSRGILSASNQTDPAQGIYQSDTEQILMNSRQGQIQVDTPRSQGASLPEEKPEVELSNLGAKAMGTRMGVFLSAIDDQTIAQSERMLLIVTTDAVNANMRFTGPDRKTLVSMGTMPVLVQTGKVEVRVRNVNARRLQLWALSVTGERKARIPVDIQADDRAVMRIDTDALPDGPAVYFELAAR
jgi:hypothetical protein